MNPYASYLGSQDPRAVTAATPGRLSALLQGLSPEALNQPLAPGKWSRTQILCHLADTEMVFAVRLRQTLAEDRHVIQPFDQDLWAKTYAAYTAEAALGLFTAVRQWNVALLDTVTPEQMERKVTHPERGEMTFRIIVETMAGHDLNHLNQLQ